MTKVLITGADGFIGSHLTEELVKQGFDVRAFSYYNSFNSWGWLDSLPNEIMSNVDVFTGDIRDPNGVKEAAKGVEQIYHLAALIAIPFSYHSPDTYVDPNIKGTLNILQAARELDISRLLITSTSEVYGTAQYVPIDGSIRIRDNLRTQQLKLAQIDWLSHSIEVLICLSVLFDH
jgi:dTDP-glucose 4,6-dehydratase